MAEVEHSFVLTNRSQFASKIRPDNGGNHCELKGETIRYKEMRPYSSVMKTQPEAGGPRGRSEG